MSAYLCQHGQLAWQCQECADENLGVRFRDGWEEITCDRCGNDFRLLLPDDKEDVFYRVQEQMGKTVCPECLEEARRP